MPNFPEAEVVRSLKRHLLRNGLRGSRVHELFVDADPHYRLASFARELEPMVSIPINGSRPDMICAVRAHARQVLVGIEVKPKPLDWMQGLTQARAYQLGVHYSYLALPWFDRNIDDGPAGRAREEGIGLLTQDRHGSWLEAIDPREPSPLPSVVEGVANAVRGVRLGRRLELNHPLNYLVVPYLRVREPDVPVLTLLERYWSRGLKAHGSRVHARNGAVELGLIDEQDEPTPDGLAVAAIMKGMRFAPEAASTRGGRLADDAPALAAILRLILGKQPGVALVSQVLRHCQECACTVPELIARARKEDPVLTEALFLDTPVADMDMLCGVHIVNSTVFQFKQVLWHAGFLATKCHTSAGHAKEVYRPQEDVWGLDTRILGRSAV